MATKSQLRALVRIGMKYNDWVLYELTEIPYLEGVIVKLSFSSDGFIDKKSVTVLVYGSGKFEELS